MSIKTVDYGDDGTDTSDVLLSSGIDLRHDEHVVIAAKKKHICVNTDCTNIYHIKLVLVTNYGSIITLHTCIEKQKGIFVTRRIFNKCVNDQPFVSDTLKYSIRSMLTSDGIVSIAGSERYQTHHQINNEIKTSEQSIKSSILKQVLINVIIAICVWLLLQLL